MESTVVIIGAAGFIARALRSRLADHYRLVSVDREPFEPVGPGELALEINVNSSSAVEAIWQYLDAERVEAVVFLAAYYDFENRDDPRYGEVERGLEATLDMMGATLRPEVPLLFSSSMASMAPTEPQKPLRPESNRVGPWAYPAHKIEAEKILEGARIANPRVELVLAGVYSDWCELVPLYKQLERVRSRSIEAFFYPGPTDRGLTYVHVDDVARAFENAIGRRFERPVQRYLIGEEAPATYEFIHNTACDVFVGRRLPVFRVPRFVAWFGAWLLGLLYGLVGRRRFVKPWMVQFAGEHFEFDISSSRRDLEWQPEHALHDELREICERADSETAEWTARNDARPY